jgi:hypothetical protein
MDDYFVGALLQLLERAKHLNTRVPRELEREFHSLVTTCQAEVTRIINTVKFLLKEPALRLPANQPERLRMFRRAVADLDVVETVGFAAIERANKEDIRLNKLMDRIRLEINYPLLPPVVTSLSQAYFRIFPSLNLLCVPLTEGRFLLHLPDLYHELGHPLLTTLNNPVVEPFRQALNQLLEAAMVYLDGETRIEERRRGPAQLRFMLDCWARSWVSWSVEFLCDLFGALMIGPAFAWSHLHLCAKRGTDPFAVPSFAPTSHPPDAARMDLVLKGLARCGFTADTSRIQARWQEFLSLVGGKPEPEFNRCFPNRLLDDICNAAWTGITAMGCRAATPSTNDEVYTLLNGAWDQFWRAPADYGTWEQTAVAAIFNGNVRA